MLHSFSHLTVATAIVLGCVSPGIAQERGDLYRIRDGVSRTHVEYHSTTVPKGKEIVLADLKGPGKITYFYVTPVCDLALKVFWDDESEPSIQTPLADFFGALRGKTVDYHSQPMEIQHRCYMCHRDELGMRTGRQMESAFRLPPRRCSGCGTAASAAGLLLEPVEAAYNGNGVGGGLGGG
jgi:hypothetical protein